MEILSNQNQSVSKSNETPSIRNVDRLHNGSGNKPGRLFVSQEDIVLGEPFTVR
jgi:hypothetical protein